MTDPNKAVFLSYASQDEEAAKRICDALRAAVRVQSAPEDVARFMELAA